MKILFLLAALAQDTRQFVEVLDNLVALNEILALVGAVWRKPTIRSLA